MIFTESKLAGAFIIDLERRGDSRGYFARTFCQHEFEEHGLKPVIAQANIGFNRHKGTLRGMHFSSRPRGDEARALHARRDPRHHCRPPPGGPTFLEHVEVELSADNGRALYVPERFAHSYQVLEDNNGDQLPGWRVLHAVRRGRPVAPSIPTSASVRLCRSLTSRTRTPWAPTPRRSFDEHQVPDGGRDRTAEGCAVILVDTALRGREGEWPPDPGCA